jgi:hypothetical protein
MHRSNITLLLATAMVLFGCGELMGGAGPISKRIGELARETTAKEVDLGKLTTFGWDKVYFFKSGAPKKEVCEFIQADERECPRIVRHESIAGESMTLVFSLRDSLTHVELHLLENGKFDITPTKDGLPREKAIFKIRREIGAEGKSVYWLEPK